MSALEFLYCGGTPKNCRVNNELTCCSEVDKPGVGSPDLSSYGNLAILTLAIVIRLAMTEMSLM